MDPIVLAALVSALAVETSAIIGLLARTWRNSRSNPGHEHNLGDLHDKLDKVQESLTRIEVLIRERLPRR